VTVPFHALQACVQETHIFHTGPSSSGKTTLSRLLHTAFTSSSTTSHPLKCIIIHGDDFYIPDSQLPIKHLAETDQDVADWDCPEALDFDRFLSSVRYAKAHGELPKEHETFEEVHAAGVDDSLNAVGLREGKDMRMLSEVAGRWVEALEHDSGRSGGVRNVVIVDGFLLFGKGVPVELRREFDVKFFVRAPYEKVRSCALQFGMLTLSYTGETEAGRPSRLSHDGRVLAGPAQIF
jgi:nicotinamide/nicotinate riboside kinase